MASLLVISLLFSLLSIHTYAQSPTPTITALFLDADYQNAPYVASIITAAPSTTIFSVVCQPGYTGWQYPGNPSCGEDFMSGMVIGHLNGNTWTGTNEPNTDTTFSWQCVYSMTSLPQSEWSLVQDDPAQQTELYTIASCTSSAGGALAERPGVLSTTFRGDYLPSPHPVVVTAGAEKLLAAASGGSKISSTTSGSGKSSSSISTATGRSGSSVGSSARGVSTGTKSSAASTSATASATTNSSDAVLFGAHLCTIVLAALAVGIAQLL